MGKEMTSWDEYVARSAEHLGFTLEPGWKEGTRANIETIFKLAALVESFPLPDDIEPAPIFEA